MAPPVREGDGSLSLPRPNHEKRFMRGSLKFLTAPDHRHSPPPLRPTESHFCQDRPQSMEQRGHYDWPGLRSLARRPRASGLRRSSLESSVLLETAPPRSAARRILCLRSGCRRYEQSQLSRLQSRNGIMGVSFFRKRLPAIERAALHEPCVAGMTSTALKSRAGFPVLGPIAADGLLLPSVPPLSQSNNPTRASSLVVTLELQASAR